MSIHDYLQDPEFDRLERQKHDDSMPSPSLLTQVELTADRAHEDDENQQWPDLKIPHALECLAPR